jgi:putative glutamine amidotransferase
MIGQGGIFMKPLIGITMNLEEQPARLLNALDQDYGKAIVQAGGIPVPVVGIESAIPDLVKNLDGFLFTGGDDIDPRFYKEKPLAGSHLRIDSDNRVRFEMKLFRSALKASKPVLAICYGAQMVNVALGGTLFQDIKQQIPNSIKHGADKKGVKVFHSVDIFEGTKLCGIMGNCGNGDCSIRVRSSHHQSIKNPGRGLRLSAVSPDGVYEALETRGSSFVIAVQWHPEKTPADQASRKLFAALVSASKR